MLNKSQTLTIFKYHRVLPQQDKLQPEIPTAKQFDLQLKVISKFFNIIDLKEGVSLLTNGNLPPRAAALTFDDGYKDNHDIVLPILKKHNLKATFFLIVNPIVSNEMMWNDYLCESIRSCNNTQFDLTEIGLGLHNISNLNAQRAVLSSLQEKLKYSSKESIDLFIDHIAKKYKFTSSRLMLDCNEVKTLFEDGMSIASHGLDHNIWTTIDSTSVQKNIVDSKQILEGLIKSSIDLIAYPNGRKGDYDDHHISLIKQHGYLAACTTSFDKASKDMNIFELPRVSFWGEGAIKYVSQSAKLILS